MEQKRTFSPPLSGVCSLLVIFSVLVFSVFMMLTVTTVQADKRLSDTYLEAAEAYYAADLQAEQIFARIRGGETLPQVQQTGNTYHYTCAISETQQLEVTLLLKDGAWQVLRWQAAAVSAAEAVATLPVWDGITTQEEDYD